MSTSLHYFRRILAVSMVLMMVFPLCAEEPGRIKQVEVYHLKGKITVDGRLDEADWQEARAAGEFVEYAPAKGQPSLFQTEFKVLMDSQAIYFGIMCHDPEPERLIANLTRRDSQLDEDDAVLIALDTFHDLQNAYFFQTNILGTQSDGRYSDNGRTTDAAWDIEWQSAGSKSDFGWSAELRIPFSSIKYKAGNNRTWGLGVIRRIPRRLAADLWQGDAEFPQRISRFGVLTGLSLPNPRRRFELVPHLVGRVEEHAPTDLQLGLDARYAISQSASANLTINPDFATIEADQEQVNLTRFELSLSEKRQFFLEGADIYQQRIQLFYSRRIADIYGGLKAYGKSKSLEWSALSVESKPFSEKNMDQANYTILRLKKSVRKSSSIGLLAANRLMNGINSGTAGLDATLFFTEKLNFTGQMAASWGPYRSQNIAFFLRPSYDSATTHFHVRYTHLGEKFADNANAVGFISDDNRRELDSALEKTWWLKKNFLERIMYNSNYNIFWGMDGTRRSWKVDQSMEFDLRNKFSLEFSHTQEYKLYEKGFRNWNTGIGIGYNTREWQMVRAEVEFGRNFDSDFQLYTAALNRKIGKKLSLEYDLSRLILDPDPEGETTWIHVLRLNYFFSKDLFLKFFYQINAAIEKKNIQLVFVYRFRPPFGLIQLAFQQGSVRFGEVGDQRPALFLKFAYVL